ncbi:hypothetical protein TYRP_008581 [Tyrophagus putrescentiae]|nr:hypothetical protein TYRP_008581 [Tyrophagus putrescentiae]
MFASQFQYPFWKVDYYAAYAYHYPSEYNATLALIINNAIVFGIICQLLLYYSDVDSFAWAEMADLVVGNVDIYFNCLNTVKHISNSNSRIWLLRLLDSIELYYPIFIIIYVSMSLNYFGLIGFTMMPHYPASHAPFILLDLATIVYSVFVFLELANICCLNGLVGGFLYHHYTAQIHCLLNTVLRAVSAANRHAQQRQPLIQRHFQHLQALQLPLSPLNFFKLKFVLFEHSRLCVYARRADEQLWSRMLLAFIPVQLLSMIFLSVYLMLGAIPPGKFLFYSLVLLLYVVCFVLILFALSYISYLLHKIAGRLNSVQLLLSSKEEIQFKLKFMNFFERLTAQTKYGLTVGSIVTVTYTVVGQVYFEN